MKAVVTGGAGFIGSHLLAMLVAEGYAVTVLDDLSTGRAQDAAGARLVVGSVTDRALVREICDGADVVLHHAAHRAVPRSVEDPLGTDAANTHGSLTVLEAARDAGVRRVILAGSSSVYGGTCARVTEDHPTSPRSPYAVSKLAMEHYARVATDLHGLDTVCLRYFNVYGPRQRPDGAYATVIPRFVAALARGERPQVHGDGRQSRDFTFVGDVVEANRLALRADAAVVAGRAYNVASGATLTVLQLLDEIAALLGVEADPCFVDPRPGDVRATAADTNQAEADLGFVARTGITEGLARTVAWMVGSPVLDRVPVPA